MSSKKQKKNLINKGHYLELMDRIHIAACMIDDHILNHPLSENEPDIQNKLDEALSLLLANVVPYTMMICYSLAYY